jgi:transcriptional regulator with XRE-family HTH domain
MLRKARENQGLTLYALSKISGVDRSLLWKIERGDVNDPRPENLARIAESLGLSMTDLYARAGYVSAERLPNLPAYLRAKYGYLTTGQQDEVVAFFQRIEAEYGGKQARLGTAKPGRGDRHGDDD